MTLKILLLIMVIMSIGASASDIDKSSSQKLFFYGTIGKEPIRMILDRNNTVMTGFYYTPEGFASNIDINISGTVSENGTLSLKNVNNISFIGKWKQQRNKPIVIDGTISASKTAKKKTFHFEQEPIFLNENQKILTREIFEDYTKGKVHQEISLSSPEFKGSSLVNQQVINKEFYKFIDPHIEEIKKWNEEYSKNRHSNSTTTEFSSSYKINYFDASYLSITYDGYITSAGGNSPYVFFKTLTINLSTGEIMELQDFFHDNSSLKVISKHVRAKLMDEYSRENEEYSKNSAPNEDNFNIWALTPTGIEVYFQKYSIGCGVEGSKQIIIPYKEFGNNLKLQLDGVGYIDEKLDKKILSSNNVKQLDSDMDRYYAKVQGFIYAQFHPAPGTEGFSARIHIVLSADGKLDSYRVISYSRNALFNEELDSLKERLRQVSFPKNPNRDEAIFEIILTSKD